MTARTGRRLALAALTALGLGSGLTAVGSAALPHDQILSNEMSFTRWANPSYLAPIYSQPSATEQPITKLRWHTEDAFPEVYVLLRAHWAPDGTEWIELRIPARPNGQVGWVQRSALGPFHLTHQRVVVNRARLRLYFFNYGRHVWSAPVAIGKPSTPTPAGRFWIREKFPRLPRSSLYYPYAFGTADYSGLTEWPRGGVVGIHGPYGATAAQIPGRISHGCIRLRIADDNWLGHHLNVGAPLRII
jgi:hypothetical protein